MRLLITRPKNDAERFAAIVTARGHSAVVAPMMETHFRDGAPLDLSAVQAILATSANGVRALIHRTPRRDIAVYAVGPQTAEVARGAGFHPVESAEGDANALADLVAARLDAAGGTLFHPAGAETAGRLRQNLQARGFTVQTTVLYEAVPVDALPDTARDALAAGTLDGVLLFSPRSAKIFAALVAAAGLSEACARLDAYCISAATASALGTLAFARIAVAGAPNQESILTLLPAQR